MILPPYEVIGQGYSFKAPCCSF